MEGAARVLNLKQIVRECQTDPSVLHKPSLLFFKDYLQRSNRITNQFTSFCRLNKSICLKMQVSPFSCSSLSLTVSVLSFLQTTNNRSVILFLVICIVIMVVVVFFLKSDYQCSILTIWNVTIILNSSAMS